MLLSSVFDRFVQESPVAVMARGLLEHVLTPASVDALFEQYAEDQYTRELLFSQVVDLMGQVVCGIYPSANAAYQKQRERFTVSRTAVYDKLNGVEPQVSAALTRQTAADLTAVIGELGSALPDLLPGYRVKILDGNCLAKTEHRLQELRTVAAGPLPGKSLVVLDPALMLAIDVFPCEDGHTQERALLDQVLATVETNDVWIEDRNFCTLGFLFGIAARQACFVVRQHQNLPWEAVTELEYAGVNDDVEVWEQKVRLDNHETGETMIVRRLELRLPTPTRDGDRVIYVLTNLPAGVASASMVAGLYRKRWKIETLFQILESALESEQTRLGYPKAGLFAFCVSLVAYNVLAVVRAALRAVHTREVVEENVSTYYLTHEIKGVYQGMMIAVPAAEWEQFRKMTTAQLAAALKALATKAQLSAYQRHPRGPKKPRPERIHYKDKPHVSTARLIANRCKEKRSP
jgi:Transposase DDE domain